MNPGFQFPVFGFQFHGTGHRFFAPNRKQKTGNRKLARRTAFTLIEIVLAIGIMSFALVGILGLFPVALDTARDSKAETQISLLARQIESDLRASQIWSTTPGAGGTSTLVWTARLFNASSGTAVDQIGSYNTLTCTTPLPATGSQTATTYLAYTLNDNQELMPNGNSVSSLDFDQGVTGAVYVSRIEATYNDPDHPGLVRILITVEVPGSAPASARRSYDFFTLLGQRE